MTSTSSGLSLDRRELARLVIATGQEAQELRERADRLRHETVGDVVHLRAIIEFSNHCQRNCAYCGLRAQNRALPRYRMSPEEVLETARLAAEMGFGTVVLQSGEDLWWTGERLAELLRKIKTETDLAVTLSVGERDRADYALWRETGADRYLLRHETADPAIYARLHPGYTLATRLGCIETLLELGYQVGMGCIIGLPGQTAETLADDILLMRRYHVHMAGVGPLIPNPNTPLAAEPVGSTQITLNTLALTRLAIPDVMLPTTTALETATAGGRLMGLQAGANVIMPNLTPRHWAQLYELYPGKVSVRRAVQDDVARVRELIAQAGRTVATGPGHSPRARPQPAEAAP